MKPSKRNLQCFATSIAIIVSIGCKNASSKFGSPAAYDFSKPEKFIMPEALQEISGHAFYKLDPSIVYSIQDEDGRVFSQQWGNKKATVTKFAGKGDYEDLALMGDSVFVLKSSGSLYAFPRTEIGKKEADHVKEWKKLIPKGEYESLYADESTLELVVLCKECDVDKKKLQATGYVLGFDKDSGNLALKTTFSLNTEPIQKLGYAVEHGLRASALSRNPVTKDWYILSSVNKILVVADSDWNVKTVYRLDSGMFNQPEGIAFDKNQNLYISSEGDEITNGNILKFTYNKPK
jgi:hypothetical protein